MKKYEFTGETVVIFGVTFNRIRALVRIKNEFFRVNPGELGGWIESEDNLSHEGNCWVCGDAEVYGDAKVCGNAWVGGNARVYGDAEVCGNARVGGYAMVCGNARVCGDAWIYKKNHSLVIGPIGSPNAHTTFFHSKNGDIKVVCGRFYGTIDEFSESVKTTHSGSKYENVYNAAVNLAKIQIEACEEN